MRQSRFMSLVESIANVVVGYSVAVVTQILIFPVFGLHTTLVQNAPSRRTAVECRRTCELRQPATCTPARAARPSPTSPRTRASS